MLEQAVLEQALPEQRSGWVGARSPAWAETTGLLATPDGADVATAGRRAWVRPDGRRSLQLVLATIWLLDGILQLQAYFFTRSFGTQMIAPGAQGLPSVIARPITWSGLTIGHHAVITNLSFALLQVGLGLGIAWRPTVKVALGASIAWSVGVWWIGEGLGGVFSGTANPVDGAPGAVILYGLLAVLLWPRDRPGPGAPFIAARAVGEPVAKAVWLVLWGSLSYFALSGANRSSQGVHDLIDGMTVGEPGWLRSLNHHAATLVDHRGLATMAVLAVLSAVVAVGVYLPPGAANAAVVAAVVISLLWWVVGEDLGQLFTNGATDVNSGPLLILTALAYWRHRRPSAATAASVRRFAGECLRCRAPTGWTTASRR